MTFTFDDFPKTAWRNGGVILNDYKLTATYFVSGALCGKVFDGVEQFDETDLAAAFESGHEIGSHLYFHSSVLQSGDLTAAIAHNDAFLSERLGGIRATSFAYPYGDVSLGAKIVCRRHYACCRGVRPGLNTGDVELAHLKAECVFARTFDTVDWEALFDEASRRHAWLILVLHDVDDTPSDYGCTPKQLQRLIKLTRQAGLASRCMKSALAELAMAT